MIFVPIIFCLRPCLFYSDHTNTNLFFAKFVAYPKRVVNSSVLIVSEVFSQKSKKININGVGKGCYWMVSTMPAKISYKLYQTC